MDSMKISIAGTDYTIRPLTVGQLEAIHIGVLTGNADAKNLKALMTEWWQETREAIVAALSEDHPDMTMDAVKKLHIGTFPIATEIRSKILVFAGFETPKAETEDPKKDEDQPSGEAPAAAE